MGIDINTTSAYFYVPEQKLTKIAAPAGGASAAAPERGALAGPSAPTSNSTRWALVNL
jgi:hypothetical protein